MRVVVIGGGITGQLVQFHCPLARVFDWGPPPVGGKLTRHYGANYLWKPLDGLPCSAFPVVTHVDGLPATEDSIRRYKEKIGKMNDGGDWGLQFQTEMTGYEIERLPTPTIEYNTRILEIQPRQHRLFTGKGEVVPYDVLVSTIPLNAFIGMFAESRDELMMVAGGLGRFLCRPIYVRITPRPPDAPYGVETLYVNYLSNPDNPVYRYADRQGERHYEGLTSMGTLPHKKLFPGKLIPPYPDYDVLDVLRQKYDICCFGRYATWRPDELVHNTWDDLLEWKRLWL